MKNMRFAKTKLTHTSRWTQRPRLRAALLALALGGTALSAEAATIPIPNGDFSVVTNFGTIGGGLIGASATDVPIGTGPWLGSYFGVLGLLAPPQLTISAAGAAVSGIAGINILGILDNGGSFEQQLAAPYLASRRYTLSARVDAGAVLDLAVLGQSNVGLGLGDETSILASTATAPPQLIHLTPLGGTEYLLSLAYETTDTVAGDVSVHLLAEPQALIGVGLLSHVTYRNVTLDASLIDPSAGSVVGVEGTIQQAVVAQPFALPLSVRVTDVDGDGVSGVAVTFTAPASGASAILDATNVSTDSNGYATIHATASTVAGSYTVAASVSGVPTPATFSFTNLAGAPASLTPVGPGGTQTVIVSTPFDDPLVVASADSFGNPTPGVIVHFDAPTSGASATLNPTTATTNASGLAQTEGTANAIPGDYVVIVSIEGSDVTASIPLTNALPDGTTIIDDGSGDVPQSADLDTEFSCALVAYVALPGGAPYAGVQVEFQAPATGASAVLTNGTDSGATVFVTTDANGAARVVATSNDVAGDYTISATLIGGQHTDPVTFAMRNLESLIFRDGFDRPCSSRSTP